MTYHDAWPTSSDQEQYGVFRHAHKKFNNSLVLTLCTKEPRFFDFLAIAAASSTSRLANAIAEEEMPFDSGPLGSGSWLVGLKYCRIDMING